MAAGRTAKVSKITLSKRVRSNLRRLARDDEMKAPISGAAIWAVIGASIALDIFGWAWTTGVLALILGPLAVACEVWASRLPLHIQRASGPAKAVLGAFLLLICVGFDTYSAHRALGAVGAFQAQEYADARAEVDRAAGALAAKRVELNNALETVPENAGPIRAGEAAARNDIRREKIQPKIDAAEIALAKVQKAVPHKPSDPLPEYLIWLILGFVEILKVAGFWILAPAGAAIISFRSGEPKQRERAEAAPSPAPTAGQALAAKRWADRTGTKPQGKGS